MKTIEQMNFDTDLWNIMQHLWTLGLIHCLLQTTGISLRDKTGVFQNILYVMCVCVNSRAT